MILNVVKNLKKTPHHLNCEFTVFFFYNQAIISPTLQLTLVNHCPFTAPTTNLIKLLTTFRPMVSEPINSSLFHQLAEQLQQQNLEQFQKQLLEHQQHQQKV